jgi:hypothetical protein
MANRIAVKKDLFVVKYCPDEIAVDTSQHFIYLLCSDQFAAVRARITNQFADPDCPLDEQGYKRLMSELDALDKAY